VFTFVCLGTNNPERTVAFYDATLGALGLSRCHPPDDPEWDGWFGWGTYENGGAVELALWACTPFDGKPATVGNGTMVALRAKSWSEVDNFYAAAMANGGTSEGAPGIRLHYNPDFYAAYVRDPDGNKLAAVCRGFTERESR
jgi:catechol 2,3-dioxygenase-like lactoylglutathione lyase family enzyme